MNMIEKVLVILMGVIGVGKSTVLASMPDCYRRHIEPVEANPWLSAFGAELKMVHEFRKIGRTAQLSISPWMEFFLQGLWKNTLEEAFAESNLVISDFVPPGVYARNLFVSGDITQLDYDAFLEVEKATQFRDARVITIWLDNTQLAWQNKIDRNRDCEKDLPYEYFQGLRDSISVQVDGHNSVYRLDWPKGGNLGAVEAILEKEGLPGGVKPLKIKKGA